MNPAIRDATPADYATFRRLFQELGVDGPPAPLETFVETFMPTMFFAEENGEAIGYTFFWLLDGGAHLGQIATAPTARRRGVGRLMMAEAAKRAKALGATWWQLQVKPDNVAALRLYESFGMKPDTRSWAVWIDWTAILAQPAPFVGDVRVLDPSEDAEWERRLATPAGLLPMVRGLSTRIFRALEPHAFLGFDVAFPSAFPFYAPDAPTAFSLLHAVRSVARPELATISVTLDNEAVKDALFAAGARLRFERLRMRGAL